MWTSCACRVADCVFIELVDALRCPVPHEESWLVAAARRMEARHIVDGTLGCPVCAAEYPIRDGVVNFRRGDGYAAAPGRVGDANEALRLAALLNLSDAQGFAVLLGDWGNHALELSAACETPLILVDPPIDIVGSPGISVLRTDGPVPLASGAARGAALDVGTGARTESAVRATRPMGRVVAPVDVTLPGDVRELARDDTMWVGERQALPSPPVTLHVRRS